MTERSNVPVSPAISARIVHGSMALGIVLFWVVAWFTARDATPAMTLPDPRVLYLVLILASVSLFGAAIFAARRLPQPAAGATVDQWWVANLGRAIVVWALLEGPALLGLVIYFLTRDSRVLAAPLVGLLLFATYRPSRLIEG